MKVTDKGRPIGDDGRAVPFVATPNLGGAYRPGRPNFLIIHDTAAGAAAGSIAWLKTPASQASAHLVIDRTGAIPQMAGADRITWHAGESSWQGIVGLNAHPIGIEIANWGVLDGGLGHWRTRTGVGIPDDRVVVAPHKSSHPSPPRGWEAYDEAAIEATLAASAAIVAHFAIPEANVLGHDDISPGRKTDPGPAWNMGSFRERRFGRAEDGDDLLTVRSTGGLNLREAPGLGGAIKELLPDGRVIRRIGVEGAWMMVTTLDDRGRDDKTGWVHGRWLAPVV